MAKKAKEKWDFMKGEETVYSSALDIFGDKENRALAKCLPKMAEIMESWGWGTRLADLSESKVKQLIIHCILEFEKWMKMEQIPEGEDNPLFFLSGKDVDMKLKIDLPPDYEVPPSMQSPTKNPKMEPAIPPPGSPGGLIPAGMSAPPAPRTGPVTDEDFPWKSQDEKEGGF